MDVPFRLRDFPVDDDGDDYEGRLGNFSS